MSDTLVGKPGEPPAQTTNTSVVNLKDKAGAFQRLLTGIAVSGEAGRGIRELESATIRAEVSIGKTVLAIASTKIKTALVAKNMSVLGSLITSLNCATDAVDMSLTNAAAAGTLAHLENRNKNRDMFADMRRNGKLDSDEEQILQTHREAHLAEDISASLARMKDGKTAVSILHGHALSNIESARVDPDKIS